MKVSISWAFAGNAVYAACQWIVFVLLVRSLQLSDAGTFAYWLAVTGPVFILANARLRNVLATGVSSPGDFGDYLRARLLTTVGALVIVLLLGAALAGDRASLLVLVCVGCAKSFDALSDICHGLFQRELDMRSAAIGLITNGILSVTLVAGSLAVWPSLTLASAGYAAASLLALLFCDLPRVRRRRPGLERLAATGATGAAARLLRRAAPLGLSSAVGSLQTFLPRYVVAIYLGPAALAVFTALAYIPTLGNLLANAIAQAALPVLAADLRGAAATYRKRVRTLVQSGVALGLAGLLGVVLAGRPLLAAIYGADVAGHHDILLWLMIAAAASYAFLFLGTATTARARYGAQLAISAGALLTVATAVVPLVGRYGLRGAALALCAGAFVELCAYVLLTLHDFRSDARLQAGRIELAEACGG